MTAISALRAGTAGLALLVYVPPAVAQFAPAPQFVPVPTPTADALAAQMRQLGANPRDVSALIAAGELSTKLGDPAAALGFFGRAQAIEPANPRVAAGKAGALVLLERPGEALQLYAQAERAGLAMDAYLVQRGLAYDLIGQPGYAQRDYRRALLLNRDDETVRRLALSLGISGRRDEAMTLLDPLLRRSDRAAWRARACILAVSGDVAGAQRIAASMMAGGAALSPFFNRLQWLSPVDRAFAVHFGEVSATVARATDARLAPALAVLPVEPQALPSPAPVVASDVRTRSTTGREARRRPGREPITVAAVTPTSAPVLPEPPGPPTVQLAMRDPVPSPIPNAAALPSRTPTPSTITMRAPDPTLTPSPAAAAASSTAHTLPPVAPPPPMAAADTPPTTPRTDAPAMEIVTLPPRRRPQPVAAPPPPQPQRVEAAPTPTPAIQSAAEPVRPTPQVAPPPPPRPVPALPPTPMPRPAPIPTAVDARPVLATANPVVVTPVVVQPTPMPVSPPPRPTPEPRTPEIARRNTQLLASIIDTIAVPASELDVASPPRSPARAAADAKPAVDAKKADTKKAEARQVDARKSDPKKPDPAKAEKKPDSAKAEPARWWVQVAGGANAADLGKDWRRLTAKSSTAFRGRSAWTTPLRATNRLLAGPFKSQSEASAFVNALAKDGLSAFAWQSEAGQKIERLSSK